MKKKLLAALVCAMMVTGLLPAASLAGSGQTELYINQGSIEIGDGTVSGYTSTGVPVTKDNSAGYRIIGGGSTTDNTITVTGGTHKITLDEASIDVSGAGGCAFAINSGATVNLDLVGDNKLVSGANYAGLQVPLGATVSITGTGSLTATGGDSGGAGIGGGSNESRGGGTVAILGGTVTANGGSNSAGIGGGNGGNGGAVTISGGTVTATSKQHGAGIGGGDGGDGGTVNISGGTVTATGEMRGAGIGGGNNEHKGGGGGTVTISGGTVTATGISGSAGIGGGAGSHGDGGTVTISGGNVKASGSGGGAGIGGGDRCNGGTVTISGGNVKATGSGGGADIGAGAGGSSSGTLTNGTVSVYRIALTLDGAAADTPIASLNATGVSYTYTYGMNDVKQPNRDKLYLYLPKDTVVNSITTGDSPARLFTNQTSADILVAGDHSSTGTLKEPTATISNVTVSGVTDKQITPTYLTITLTGIAFSTLRANDDVSGWFPNMPAGLSAKIRTAVTSGATTAQVTFSGTPTATSSAEIAVTIPKASLSVNIADLTANANGNAMWDIVAPTNYEITQGQNGKYTRGSSVGLSFTANGDYSKFTNGGGVSVDGAELSGSNYSSQSGSTIVTLKAAYLETLADGQHTLRIIFSDGYSETRFTILARATVPETGDSAQPMLWLGIALLAGAGLAVSVVRRRKRQNR